MSSLEESLAITKKLYPNLEIRTVSEFTDLCKSTPEEKQKALHDLVVLLSERSLEEQLTKKDRDLLSIKSSIDSLVRLKYYLTPRYPEASNES